MKRKRICAVTLSLAISLIMSPAIARTCGPGANSNLGNAMDKSAANAAQTAVNRVEQVMTKPAPVSQTTCFDKYTNGGLLNTLFSVPSFDSMLNGLANQICSAIDTEIANATQPLKQNLQLPYGMGGVSTSAGLGNASQSGIQYGQQSAQVQSPSLMSRITGWFK